MDTEQRAMTSIQLTVSDVAVVEYALARGSINITASHGPLLTLTGGSADLAATLSYFTQRQLITADEHDHALTQLRTPEPVSDAATRTVTIPAETAEWLLRLADSISAGSALRHAHSRALAEQVTAIFGPASATTRQAEDLGSTG